MPGSSAAVRALRNPLRAFVHRQIAADAVAGAVIEIQPALPQRVTREGVEIARRRALGKARRGNGDMALQHQREALAHFLPWVADGDRARHVGRAVLVLAARVDQEQLARLELAVGGAA